MFLSVFDMFKVGVGPSSSHTIGPMVAAARFLDHLRAQPFKVARLHASLHGSLAFTGVGHATDRAVILGLAGFRADDYDADKAEAELARIKAEGVVEPDGLSRLIFAPADDLEFDYGPALPGHANGLILRGRDAQGDTITEVTYYSIGGGFVLTAEELAAGKDTDDGPPVPFPFTSAREMLDMAAESGLSIADMKRENEHSRNGSGHVSKGLARIWDVMNACIDRGLTTDGILPGGLHVKRRAKAIHDALQAERGMNLNALHTINDWMSTYAMAVNEENAAGGQVVTAPTNGAAEVGSAAAMAAAGLCAVMGGTPEQIENAAEIALEHHLGMTCDPVRGLVQVPCIERNGLGAIKAVSAASLSLRGDGTHLVPLDAAIETMRQTGADMSEKYKETALGGLAVNVPNC